MFSYMCRATHSHVVDLWQEHGLSRDAVVGELDSSGAKKSGSGRKPPATKKY